MPTSVAATVEEDLARVHAGFKVGAPSAGETPMTADLEDLLEFWFGSPPNDADGVSGHMSRWFSADSDSASSSTLV